MTDMVEKNEKLESKVASLKDELYLLQLPVREPEPIGKGLQVCGKCHHKGHRNDARHECEYIRCIGYHYCGNKKLHPEYSQKLFGIKKQIKDLEKQIMQGKESIKTMSDFESKSEAYFFSEMMPRLKKIDTLRYNNKAALFKDLRILKTAFNSKVPDRQGDDKTFLKSVLDTEYTKIKQTSGRFMLDDQVSPVKTSREISDASSDSSSNESSSSSSDES